MQEWSQKISNGECYVNYNILKRNISMECYLTELLEYLLYTMAEFRTKSQKLAVNSYNNQDVDRMERFYPHCDNNSVSFFISV